jgi:hypothetical protein
MIQRGLGTGMLRRDLFAVSTDTDIPSRQVLAYRPLRPPSDKSKPL